MAARERGRGRGRASTPTGPAAPGDRPGSGRRRPAAPACSPAAARPYPAAGASQWAYATSLIQIRLGPVNVRGGPNADGVDRSNNTAEVYAERMAAAAWDGCCHLAAEFNVATCGIGGS